MTACPKVVAHRGARAYRSEHTLAAYEVALAQGAGAWECDVRLTKDGHLVCVHDRTVRRTSNGTGAVSALTLAQLNRLDFDQDRPGSDSGNKPLGVLTLTALLELLRNSKPELRLFIETKHPVRYAGLVERKLIELLDYFGFLEPKSREDSQIALMSFSSTAVRRMHGYAPALPTVFLFETVTQRQLWRRLPVFADIAGPSVELLRASPEDADLCGEYGQDIYCWTANEPEDIQLCQQLGVRYLATDDPVLALTVLKNARPA